MALEKSIPVITLACLIMGQPIHAFSLPDSVQVKLDEATVLIEAGYDKACSTTRNVTQKIKSNKEKVLAVASVAALVAYCAYEAFYAEPRQALPGEPSINDIDANNKNVSRYAKAKHYARSLVGLLSKEEAKTSALTEKIADNLRTTSAKAN